MVFRRGMGLRPINSTKHIVDTSTIIPAVTNTTLQTSINAVDNPVLANTNNVRAGSKISSIFYSIFVYSEGGEVANEVPLVDFYFIKSPGSAWITFGAGTLPTPGATGAHLNKRQILHEEKGLAGGEDASLTGVPMVFKGVIRIPRGKQRFGQADLFLVNIRTNFASKVCCKAIYKEYN